MRASGGFFGVLLITISPPRLRINLLKQYLEGITVRSRERIYGPSIRASADAPGRRVGKPISLPARPGTNAAGLQGARAALSCAR